MLSAVKRNTFRKSEKICNQNQIDRLFKEGKPLKAGLFRLLFVINEISAKLPVQVLIAVPKKNLHHAVDRNRMKRLIREAYRLNKHIILDACLKNGKHIDIAFIFMGKQCVGQAETVSAINILLDRLVLANEKNSE